MRILIVGAGATGGYFGARLARAGRDVTFLVRPRRADQVRRDGVRVAAFDGTFVVRPQAIVSGEAAAPFDVVLLAVKAYDLDAALDDLAPYVGAGTTLVPFLNGMRHIDALVKRFGPGPAFGGICMVSTQLDADGTIRQFGAMQALTYGELDGSLTPRARAVHAALAGAGFEATLTETIVQSLWQKWTGLASTGAINCTTRGTIGDALSVRGGPEFARAVYDECAAVATAAGYPPSAASRALLQAMLSDAESDFTTSMYRDLLAGSRIEGEQIVGDMVEQAHALGVAVPRLEAAAVMLRVYERRRDARFVTAAPVT
jgi:2-dehydropantoate 2-reductase